jgi:hypothetical protein
MVNRRMKRFRGCHSEYKLNAARSSSLTRQSHVREELATVWANDRQHCVNALRERGLDPYTSRYLEGQMHNTGWFDQIVADNVNAPLTPYHEGKLS